MSFTRKMSIGFLVMALLFVVTAGAAVYGGMYLNSSISQQRGKAEGMITSIAALRGPAYALSALQGMPVGAEVQRARQSALTALRAAVSDAEKVATTDAEKASVAKIKQATVSLAAVDPAQPLAAYDVATLKSSVNAFQATLSASSSAKDNKDNATTTVVVALVLIAAAAGIILSIVFGRFLSRRLGSMTHGVVTQMGASVAELGSVASQVAATATQTATAINEAATTADEVRQTSLLVSEKAAAVSDESRDAEGIAESGRHAVSENLAGIDRIREQMALVAESIVRLSEQTQAVGEIVATSNDIAEQSNLLAVNAAIEAAKASEHGKGFGVVAEEVKSLASQSKQAVVRIRGILDDIQKATGAAVMAAEQSVKTVDEGARQASAASDAIEALAESVSTSAQSAAQIAASSDQQLAGMDQITEAMSSIESAAQQNRSGASQLKAEIERLHDLTRLVNEQMVEGKEIEVDNSFLAAFDGSAD